jgi:serine phosphatase RsbU (regulator of sigma subunit)
LDTVKETFVGRGLNDSLAMPQKEEPVKKPSRSQELFFSGLKPKPVSSLNASVWKYLLLISGACLAAWLLNLLIPARAGNLRSFPLALMSLAAWALAVRLLFVETKARVFWLVWLGLGLFLLFVAGGGRAAWVPAAFFSFVFLFFRKYGPFRHLTSKRQAILFGIGLVLFVLMTVFWAGSGPSVSSPDVVGHVFSAPAKTLSASPEFKPSAWPAQIIRYSVFSLRWFWFFSLFHLVFTVRLHFMKLRPKLAVAAIFLVIVPIVLLTALAVGTIYTTLGESHAARARAILDDWAALSGSDENFIRSLSPSWFTAEFAGSKIRTSGSVPIWLPEVFAALGTKDSPLGQRGRASNAGYVLKDTSVWLMSLVRAADGTLAVRGCPVNDVLLARLARIMRSDVVLTSQDPFALALFQKDMESSELEEKKLDARLAKEAGPRIEIAGSYAERSVLKGPKPEALPFWRKPIFFGITQIEVLRLRKGVLQKTSIMLQTPRSLSTTRDELFSASNPLGLVVMAVLLALAFLFLIFETLALIFGLRISGGITKGIRALHDHLCCVSEGDLDSHIDIPNQDELGDLAASFNQMTDAVKQGREEAIARERLEKELETARQIQERLLPHKMPVLAGFELSGTSLPSHEVGGDYFDFLDLETGHLGVAIADVSGKGIPAALLMANLQASLHAQDLRPDAVSAIVARLNGLLVKNTDERMFVTFFYGILDRWKATFTYTNAGHNPPVLLRARGQVERLEEGGMLLGFLSDQAYAQAAVALEPGDVLVLFTDGITEAINPEAETREEKYFGEEKFLDVLKANAGRSVADIQAAVLSAIAAHTRRAPQSDDITLVVIKRTGGREAVAYVS